MPEPIGVDNYSRIVILTGAGVSVASGLPTFRGLGGLYTADVEWIADGRNLPGSLPDVWKLFGALRCRIIEAHPNPAHDALARLQNSVSGDRKVTLLTQNVDRLHQRAGSPDVVELHGSLLHTRCMNDGCRLTPFYDEDLRESGPPTCDLCGNHLRPDIVLFSEMLPVDAEHRAKVALRHCDLFVAIGTSGSVWPAADYVRSADFVGARTILINQEPMMPRNPYFHEEYLGNAEEILADILR